MSPTVILANPEAPPRSATTARTGRAASGAGLRLGVLDNSKANADLLLKGLLERLGASARFASVLYARKPNAAINAPREVLDELAAGADVVFSAMAD